MRRIAWLPSLQLAVLISCAVLPLVAAQASDTERGRQLKSADFQSWVGDSSYFHPFTLPPSPDNWLGGTGFWDNGTNWSAGEPGRGSDVYIDTGNDNVTLDVYTSINSLTLGGSTGSSTLQETLGRGLVVNVAGALTINQSGTLTFVNDAVIAGGASSNAGTINLLDFAQVDVTASFTNTGTINLMTNASVTFGGLNNSGQINGFDSYTDVVTVNGNLTNSGGILTYGVSANGNITNQTSGLIAAEFLTVNGNLTNQGEVMGLARGSQLAVNGQLTNSGRFDFTYANATLGSLNNLTGGLVIGGGMLTINGNTSNAGGMVIMALGPNEPFVDVLMNGNVTNSGTIGVSGPGAYERASISGGIVNSGGISVEDGGILGVVGNITNSGTIITGGQGGNSGGNSFGAGSLTNNAGGVLSVAGTGDVAQFGYVNNAGSISIANGASLEILSSHAPTTAIPGFLNSGTVLISQGGLLTSPLTYSQTSGQTTVDGALHIAGNGIVNFAGGAVYGNGGTIQGNVISNAAFNLGDMPMMVGQMAIMGNYTQGANGSLTFDIASATQYDQLNVSGHAQLNGLMTVDLLHGYIPQIGNTFDIMNFAGESGRFSMVLGLPIDNQEHFVLEYNSTNLMLDVAAGPTLQAVSGNGKSYSNEPFITPVMNGVSLDTTSNTDPATPTPEPGSILLFGSGIAAVATFVRKNI